MSHPCRAGRPRHLVGPRILGPDDARWALDVSVGPVDGPVVAVLLLDRDQRIALATVFEGATAADAPRAVGLVLDGAAGGDVRAAVVAVYRPAGSTLPFRADREAASSMRAACDDAGVELLDVLLVAGHRWRSLADTGPWRAGG